MFVMLGGSAIDCPLSLRPELADLRPMVLSVAPSASAPDSAGTQRASVPITLSDYG
jgi:hypothetical protein